MFLDVAEITVRSGRGGDGIVAFRHEAHVPRGGPGGGDGGRGGSVVFKVDPHKRTLADFHYKRVFTAQHGSNGQGSDKTGKSASNLNILVPPGTVIFDADTGEQIADLMAKGDTLLAARGGRGGRGNSAFATPTRQAPRFCEMGEKGEERRLRLEMKLIADVGLVGFPNAGKSTLISRISSARPKIAPYPFTTLQPNLGVVEFENGRDFVVADVPGLIEGAHAGVGLGHEFLRHVERTRILVHVVDVAGTEGRDPVEDYRTINRELQLHDERLAALPQFVAMNKTDVLQDETYLPALRAAAQADGREAFAISAVTGEGVRDLMGHVAALLEEIAPVDPLADNKHVPRKFEAPLPPFRQLEVRRMATGVYVVRGTVPERMIERTNLNAPDGVEWLHQQLDEAGVIAQLDEMGAEPGDTVIIGDFELEYALG
jgi:GTP-binding protein